MATLSRGISTDSGERENELQNMIRAIGSSLRGMDSSRQLAFGAALGIMIGIIPKDNLLMVALTAFLILSGANLITGALGSMIGTLMGIGIQPLLHRIGETLLNSEPIIIPLSKFLQMPLAPWTRLDNTVVAGGLAMGILVALPTYLISFYLFEKYRVQLERFFTDSRVATWILGYPSAENG